MIYVIRHGQTGLNKERRMQGRSGLPLNEIGIKQSEKLRDEFRETTFYIVYSSPQERAIQTAEIATVKNAIIDARLDVFDLGEADRLKTSEVQMAGIIPDPNVYNGVEDAESFVERVFDFMRELENNYGDKNINILLSGHRCTTGCIGAYFKGLPEDGNILRFSSDNGHYKIYNFN